MSLRLKREQEKQRKLAKKQARALKQTGQSDLNNAEIYNNRGVEYTEQGKFDLALADYNRAIQLNPNYAEFYYNRGHVYAKQKEFELAFADFNKAIELNPKLTVAYNNRGILYREKKMFDLALADFNCAIQLDSNCAEAYVNRGILYQEQKTFNLALADYYYAIRLNPNRVEAYNNRGRLYHEQRPFIDLALADYDCAIQLSSNYAEPYNNRGKLHKEQGKFDLALADYNCAIQLNPNYVITYNNRGNLYVEQEALDLALDDFNRAIQLNQNYVIAYNNRGNLHAKQGEFDLALGDFDKAIELDPKSAETHASYAILHLQQGRIDLGLPDIEKAVELDKKLQQPLFLLASRVLTNDGQFDRAKDYVKRAFVNAKLEERQHEEIYLKSIEQAQRLHKAYGRIQELVRQYSHNLGNTLFPDTLYNLAQTLKKDNNYQKEALQLYDVFNAEKTIMRQAELINIRQGQNDPKRFGELVQNSCLHHENEPGNDIQFVLDYALERMVARFLNEHYQKIKQPREKVLSKLGITLDSLRENFEQSIFFNQGDVFTWVNQYLMPIEITEFSEGWQKVKFKKEGHAETLFYSYFNELFLNIFKYADYQRLTLRFYEQAIDNKYYLMSRWENYFEDNQSNSTQRGLQGIREDLSQLNLSETPETTLQTDIKHNLFVLTLAFRRELLVQETLTKTDKEAYKALSSYLKQKKRKIA